jgi:hypothetical protein
MISFKNFRLNWYSYPTFIAIVPLMIISITMKKFPFITISEFGCASHDICVDIRLFKRIIVNLKSLALDKLILGDWYLACSSAENSQIGDHHNLQHFYYFLIITNETISSLIDFLILIGSLQEWLMREVERSWWRLEEMIFKVAVTLEWKKNDIIAKWSRTSFTFYYLSVIVGQKVN